MQAGRQAHEGIPGDMIESEGRKERGCDDYERKSQRMEKARSGADLLQILPGIDSISTDE